MRRSQQSPATLAMKAWFAVMHVQRTMQYVSCISFVAVLPQVFLLKLGTNEVFHVIPVHYGNVVASATSSHEIQIHPL